jgi:hypothetical protein
MAWSKDSYPRADHYAESDYQHGIVLGTQTLPSARIWVEGVDAEMVENAGYLISTQLDPGLDHDLSENYPQIGRELNSPQLIVNECIITNALFEPSLASIFI